MLLNYMLITAESNATGNVVNIIFAILSFVIILVLAYFTSKFIATSSTKFINGKNMEVIDSISLGNNKKIMLVKILNKVYIVGSNSSSFNLIDTIDDSAAIDKITSKPDLNPVFESFLTSKLQSLQSINTIDTDEENIVGNRKFKSLSKKIQNLKENNIIASIKDED